MSTLSLLLAQLDYSWHAVTTRLVGLTDKEYYWEPTSPAWSLRQSADGIAYLDWGDDPQPEPRPVTTIAWRMCHVAIAVFEARTSVLFGEGRHDFSNVLWPLSASTAIERLHGSVLAWRTHIRRLSDSDLGLVPRSPELSRDLRMPLEHIILWTNRELIHHGAEIALLRDIYATVESPDRQDDD